jgi:putative transposase
VLAIVDDFTRECLALVAGTSLCGARVMRELDAVIAARGKSAMVVSDNGPELISMAILRRQNGTGVGWHYIAPGKPMQNGFVETGCIEASTCAVSRRGAAHLPGSVPEKPAIRAATAS